MEYDGVKHRLELIKKASQDIRGNIEGLLERDDRIAIAVVEADSYARDLYKLMRDMAETANPALREMGLGREAIEYDIEEFVKILQDNRKKTYFASVNLDAKYTWNKHVLTQVDRWLKRLEESVDKIKGFLESETERDELERLFGIIGKLDITDKKKRMLKDEFLSALNRLNDGVCKKR